ncbi:hypothetical protein C8R47DRAFT_1213647 [Mycena vitilis]|nr:hypothetical protein C8R47DRAFT_1215987 [Mycena vitilis]KAJ6493960.1 hypothetical protein C8R47DRAFT_1213647 [Mycena vitilis]
MSAMERLSDELWQRILCPGGVRVVIAWGRASRKNLPLARALVFRSARLSVARAILFFRSLSRNPTLGRYVRYLTLYPTGSFVHQGPAFEAALASMTAVREFHILCPVDVQALLAHFRAPLRTLTYAFPVYDTFYEFLLGQPAITDISFHREFQPLGPRATPENFLPGLQKVDALVEDLPELIAGAPVRALKFRYRPTELITQPYLPRMFFTLSAVSLVRVELMACQLADGEELDLFLPSLERLVVLQDGTWGLRCASDSYPQLVENLAKRITRLRRLRVLIVVTELRARQAKIFYQAVRHHCQAPLLRHFVFHAFDACYHWPDVRALDSDPQVRQLSLCNHHNKA